MSDKQAVKEEVVVEGYGVRGKDFLEIWQSPRSPEEQIRVRTDEFVRFGNGLLATKNAEQEAILATASTKGGYLRSDPDMRKPLVCQFTNCKRKRWFSADAFTLHTKQDHANQE